MKTGLIYDVIKQTPEQPLYLYPQHQVSVGVLQLLLTIVQLLGPLLLPL